MLSGAFAALVATACAGGGDGARPDSVAPALSPAPASPSPADATDGEDIAVGGCANAESVLDDPSRRLPGALEGDVDGDGAADEVMLFLDAGAATRCQAFLSVETAEGATAIPIGAWRRDFGLPRPSLHSLVDIDRAGGAEILVNLAAGASTQFVGAFTMAAGTLEQIEIAGQPTQPQGLFGFGGSVGHLEAVDCARGRTVVISAAIPFRDVYEVRRRVFTFEGTTLQPRGPARVARVPIERLDRFGEFASSPFGSCPRV